MYAPSHASHASSAYHQVGIETGVAAASAHRLVGMLYDGFFDALAQARGALQAGRIEDKGRAIGRAVRIVEEGLRAALQAGRIEDKGRAIGRAVRIVEEGLRAALDDRQGGKLAANLKALYGYVALRLTQANLHNDVGALDECAQLIEPLRAAWQAIAPPAGTASSAANSSTGSGSSSAADGRPLPPPRRARTLRAESRPRPPRDRPPCLPPPWSPPA